MIRQMNRLIHPALWFVSRFRRDILKTLRGALHLVYLTRHPYWVSCKCARSAQFVYMVNSSNNKELDVSLCTFVHTACTLCTTNIGAKKARRTTQRSRNAFHSESPKSNYL